MASLFSWFIKDIEEKPEEKDPFMNPMLALDNWRIIHEEHGGKERFGLPATWGKSFPFLEVETSVPEDRAIGPRVRCSFCFRNRKRVKRSCK